MKPWSQYSWQRLLADEFEKEYFQDLFKFIDQEYEAGNVFPPKELIFSAFEHTPYEQVKVVILGQDPYHGPNQAHGLAFSVQPDAKFPPSLRNIYKELESDIGCKRTSPHLQDWAKEGVLLLNTVLTVEAHKAHSHKNIGWEIFTNEIIKSISRELEDVVFILWGKPAQEKIKLIDTERHHIIKSVHPSPLSAHRGFFGSKPFSETNQFLKSKGKEPINWCGGEVND